MRLNILLSAGAVLLVGICATASSHPRTYPRMRRGVPSADYQYRRKSETLVVLSTPRKLIEVPPQGQPLAIGDVKNKLRVFQLPIAALEMHDRKISGVAFFLNADGSWSLSLRADLHDKTVARESPLADAHLKRCRFQVNLRCYGDYAVEEVASNASTGKPVLFQLEPIEFWVQSGEPARIWRVGRCSWQGKDLGHKYFNLVERVEIDFAYFEPAGTAEAVNVIPPVH